MAHDPQTRTEADAAAAERRWEEASGDSLAATASTERALVHAAFRTTVAPPLASEAERGSNTPGREPTERIYIFEGSPRTIDGGQAARHLDQYLRLIDSREINSAVERVGRILDETIITLNTSSGMSTNALVELRARDGRSMAIGNHRYFPVDDGVALLHLRVFPYPRDLRTETTQLLSPRAYSSELDKFISHAGISVDAAALEQSSFLYSLARASLSETYGQALPPTRELRSLKFSGERENPTFTLGFASKVDFIVETKYSPESCRTEVRGRMAGHP